MLWVVRIRKGSEAADTALVELETGWFSNTWHMSKSGWTLLIGNNGKGTWKYKPGKMYGGIPTAFPQIKLYQQTGETVGTLEVEEYPLKVGYSGLARIDIGPAALSHYSTEWTVMR